MNIQPAALFTRRWDAFWGTTYSFELELFDEYLFRRLGDPPLNATVLVDFATLARTWESIGAGEEWKVRRVNKLYLIRAAGRPQGRFHPKTYFFGNAKEGALLVGSGNLSLGGLEDGKEVFCRFDSADPVGLNAIRSWREWMHGIVEQAGDDVLTQRWFRLRQSTKEWMNGRAEASPFVTNAAVSLLDQLVVEPKVADEVHVTAPFFDRDAEALGALVDQTRPKHLYMYLGRGTSVDGSRLMRVLKAAPGEVSVHAFDPPRFVHAKLIAIVEGKTARVLSGSANLSRTALTTSLAEGSWANTEAGVLGEMPAAEARDLFRPPELEPRVISLRDLEELSYEEADEPPSLPVRLLSARPTEDGSIEVSLMGDPPSPVYLSSHSGWVLLEGTRTVEPLPLEEGVVLVWLVDEDDEVISNRVPLDDPKTLLKQLEKPSEGSAERPRELDAADMRTPVGRVLVRLQNEFIFDLDDIESVKQAERANEDEAAETESDDFWERLAREELQLDPRAGAYRRPRGEVGLEGGGVLLLLRMMLDRTPEERHRTSGTGAETDPVGEGRKGLRWTPTQRLQVRLMNVLTRWARALADPRMNWLQPYASVRNFQALVYALAELWELRALPEGKLKLATDLVLGHFVRSEVADGYLYQVADEERREAIGRVPPEAVAVVTALAYLGLRPKSEWEANIFEWQAWLIPCVEQRLIRLSTTAAKLLTRILGEEVTADALRERLDWACDYIDDPRWCKKMQELCGVEDVRFSNKPFKYELVLEVEEEGLVDHPGIVRLIRNALDFRRADGIVIMAGPERIAVRLGEQAYVRTRDGEMEETSDVVTEAFLAELEEQGLPLRESIGQLEHSAAS